MDSNRILILFVAVLMAASFLFIQTQTGMPEQPAGETASSFAQTSTTTSVSSFPAATSSTFPRPEGGMGEVFFFYSPTCPHCVKEKAFLEGLEEEYPDLVVHYYVASENWELFSEMASRYGTSTSGVPRTFIGDVAFVGFTQEDCEPRMYEGYNAYVGCANVIKAVVL